MQEALKTLSDDAIEAHLSAVDAMEQLKLQRKRLKAVIEKAAKEAWPSDAQKEASVVEWAMTIDRLDRAIAILEGAA